MARPPLTDEELIARFGPHLNVAPPGGWNADLEVDRDGRVVEGSIEVIREDNPTATAAFLKDLRKCRFTPARIGGMPVPFKMTLGMETNRRQP